MRLFRCDKNESYDIVNGIKRFFGFEVNKLENHLIQIKTGEGKSVILGIMSILLASLGN